MTLKAIALVAVSLVLLVGLLAVLANWSGGQKQLTGEPNG